MADWIEFLRTCRALNTDEGRQLEIRARHETHSAIVLVGGDVALKVRKPVDLGFLDYSTREKRLKATQQELSLGERISPWVYRGTWSLERLESPRLVRRSSDGEAVLAMAALDESGRLDHIVRADAASAPADTENVPAGFDEVADFCATFHARSPVDRTLEGWGNLANTWHAWEVNFVELPADDPSLPLTKDVREHLVNDTVRWWKSHQDLLHERVLGGRVRDGHGDLRVEHVYMLPRIALVDPLEFSRRYRFTDVAAEIGFLAMELEELGRDDLARRYVQRYSAATGDATLAAVLPFFIRYRAVVRGKVEWIRAAQLDGEARDATLHRARALFDLAVDQQL